MLEAELTHFGLRPRQARVYLTLLALGEAPASTIAERASLPRLTTYSILERLEEMGLVCFYEKRRVRMYKGNSPDALMKWCDDQIGAIQARKSRLSSLIPQFKKYFAHSDGEALKEKPFRFIEDRFLFRNRFQKAFQACSGGAMDWIAAVGDISRPLLLEVLKESPVPPRLLVPYAKKEGFPLGEGVLQMCRVLPRHVGTFWDMGGDIWVVGGKVFFIFEVSDRFSAVEIEYSSVAQGVKALFEMLWELAKIFRENH